MPKGRGRPGETQEARLARQCGELRHENRRLRRQIGRLRRQVEQEPVERESDPEPAQDAPGAPKCPKCGSRDLGTFKTPTGKLIEGCRDCKKWRRES